MRSILACVLVLVGCVSDSAGGDAGPQQGSLGGTCFANGTCNTGLVCVVPDKCELADASADAPPSDATTNDATTDAFEGGTGACPTTGLLTWWKGENAPADAEGYLDLLEKAGPTYTAGHVGSAFAFSGTSYLEAAPGAHAALPGLTSITIEAWIDPTSVAGTILSRRSDTGNGYELRIDAGHVTFQIAGFTAAGTATLAASIPHHVAVSVSATVAQTYLDGAADGPPSALANPFVADSALVRIASGWGAAQVPKNTFSGWIDEIAVYSNALSPTEIAALYAGGPKCH